MKFYKYHGAGNDFVMIDNREGQFSRKSTDQVAWLCDRHFGIGFDQLLILEKARQTDHDFFYRIFNANGGEVEQCGNGVRCIARYS